MKSNSKFYFLLFPIIILVILFFILFPFRTIPDGIPNDYFENIDVLNDNDVDLYLYSDEIDFNEDYDYIKVFNLNDLSQINGNHINFLVIDMNKNVEMEFASEEEIRRLHELRFFNIIFVNYNTSGSTQYGNFIDLYDMDSDLIIFYYDAFGNSWDGSNAGDLPSKQILMYAIIDNIARIIEENNDFRHTSN